LGDLRLLVLLAGVLDRHLALQLGREDLDLVVGERLRRRLQGSEAHQELDDVLHPDAERLRELADGDAGGDDDRAGRLDGFARLLRLRGALLARPPVVRARTGRPAVDDDAAAAPGGSALTRSDWSLRAVSHGSNRAPSGN